MNIDIKNLDCILGMSELPDSIVDVVITSPPYNIGKDYNSYGDNLPQNDYLNWTKDWVTQVKRVMKDDGSFFLNVGGSLVNPTLPLQLLNSILKPEQGGNMEDGFLLQNTIHWIKSITINDNSTGHFKPINSKRFINDCHEYIFHLTKSAKVPLDRLAVGVPYQDKSNLRRWSSNGGNDKRCGGNNWFIPYKTIQKRDKDRPHPATFPSELPERCILLHGNPSESVVLDPFLGLGNSGIAAKKCGVKEFLGFDIDSYYAKESINNINNINNQ